MRTAAQQINYPLQTDTERQRGQCVRGRNDKMIISSTTSHGESTGRLNCNIRRRCDEEGIKTCASLMICCCVCLQRNFLLFDEWKWGLWPNQRHDAPIRTKERQNERKAAGGELQDYPVCRPEMRKHKDKERAEKNQWLLISHLAPLCLTRLCS